jgi:hypothetical protein
MAFVRVKYRSVLSIKDLKCLSAISTDRTYINMQTILILNFLFTFVLLTSLRAQSPPLATSTNSPKGLPSERRSQTVIKFEGDSLEPKNGEIRAEVSTVSTGPAPFQIMRVEDATSSNVKASNGIKLRLIRTQFKITSSDIKSLDTAKVYLFNAQKKQVQTLTDFGTTSMSAHTSGNTISSLKDLAKDKTYNLEFLYIQDNPKWKYAVAVIGLKNQVRASVFPNGEMAENFDFPEKNLMKK